jgi:S1-C subfamily serine protease
MKALCCLLLALASAVVHADQAQEVLARVRTQVLLVAALNARGLVESEGSGVLVAAGRVVTNCHVVAEAQAVRLTTADGRQLAARVLREDVGRDLCLLEVADVPAPALPMRPLADVRQGEAAYAVGNPLGLGVAVSAGLVSAIDRRSSEPRILTSAAVSRGRAVAGCSTAVGACSGLPAACSNWGRT